MLISLLSGVWPGTLAVSGRVVVVAGRVQAERAAVGRMSGRLGPGTLAASTAESTICN